MKKIFSVLLIVMMVFCIAACGNDEETAVPDGNGAVEDKGTVMMATTTSTEDTGLLDYLAPIFKEDTGWTLEWTAVGTGEALKLGENGDVDVVLVHAKASEEEFVENGFGVGKYGDDVSACFNAIQDGRLPFVSRGDDSGTDKKEKEIWSTLGIDTSANPNYVESGQGMGATITMADEMQGYCLTDRGTWLKYKNDADLAIDLNIVCEGDANLLNQYGVIAVNPEKYEDTNIEGANAFIEWICSDEVQKLIGEYGVDTYGQALFTPNAE